MDVSDRKIVCKSKRNCVKDGESSGAVFVRDPLALMERQEAEIEVTEMEKVEVLFGSDTDGQRIRNQDQGGQCIT